MSGSESVAARPAPIRRSKPKPVHTFSGLRCLAWHGELLFASHAYTLLCANMVDPVPRWRTVASFRPAWWRNLTVARRLSCRLFRDGFDSLVALGSGHLIASVPGAIVTFMPGETEFHISHNLQPDTHPPHIAATPEGKLFWGESFDKAGHREVHIYASRDCGLTWEVAYSFPKGATGRVRNIVYDDWEHCLWILTGDEGGGGSRILRGSSDLGSVETVFSGALQGRPTAFVPTRDALYFAADTPAASPGIYRLGRNGSLVTVAHVDSSSLSGCGVGTSIFFSTIAEPRRANSSRAVKLYRSDDGYYWEEFLDWQKDFWSIELFQCGNASLAPGHNATDLLALSTVAVTDADLETSLWRI